MLDEYLHRGSKTFEFLRRHAARNIQRKDNGERAIVSTATLQIEKGNAAFNSVLEDPEVTGCQVLYRPSLIVCDSHVYGHKIGFDSYNIPTLLSPPRFLDPARALLPRWILGWYFLGFCRTSCNRMNGDHRQDCKKPYGLKS